MAGSVHEAGLIIQSLSHQITQGTDGQSTFPNLLPCPVCCCLQCQETSPRPPAQDFAKRRRCSRAGKEQGTRLALRGQGQTLPARAPLRLEHGESLGCEHLPLTPDSLGSCGSIALGNHRDEQLADHRVGVGTRAFLCYGCRDCLTHLGLLQSGCFFSTCKSHNIPSLWPGDGQRRLRSTQPLIPYRQTLLGP